jgi:hypothetical protein
MAYATPPKSILKPSSYPATSSSSPREDRNREVALYHANLIQNRKDIELTILLSMETLIDYPLSTQPAFNPSAADIQTFKELLQPFQPSDYNDLIQERNINDRCGYTLCPLPRKKDGAGGTYRLLGMHGKAKNFKVVRREETEKWCSDACAKRAMYVRVQLSARPAWERGDANAVPIELLDEPRTEEDRVAERIAQMNLGGARDAADLARERGDQGRVVRKGVGDIKIQENIPPRGPVPPPSFGTDELSSKLDTMHLSLEGYTPSFGNQGTNRQEREAGDYESDEDRDWEF